MRRHKFSEPNENELSVLRVISRLGGACGTPDLLHAITGSSARDGKVLHAVYTCRARHDPPLATSVKEGGNTYLHERLTITPAGKAALQAIVSRENT